MAKKKARSREEIVKQLLDLFFRHGYDGTTLSLIAAHTGLGRASLYHHFPSGKEEMARAVLEQADIWGEEYVCKVMEDSERPAETRLREALRNMDGVHYEPGQLSPANAFVIGDGAPAYRSHVQGYFSSITGLVAELLIAIGQPETLARRRAWEFQLLWEGGLVCARVMNDMRIFRELMRNMPRYLLADAGQVGCLPEDFVPGPA